MRKLTQGISSQLLANELSLEHFGKIKSINNINSLFKAGSDSLTFNTTLLKRNNKGFVITSIPDKKNSGLISKNPRLDFINSINWLSDNNFIYSLEKGFIHPNAIIHPTAIIDKYTTIGRNSVIGPNCILTNGVILESNVKIGANTVIGDDGFGYEKDSNGKAVHFPHLGQVIVKNNVTVGNMCTIARGVIENTVINDNVKIDDHTYIAHNVEVGCNTLLMSGAKINGSVKVGKDCWIGTGAMIKEHVEVGDEVLIGMGSVIINNIKPGYTVAGNPSKIIKKIK